MQERGKRTGIDHKLGSFPIDRTIHIQIKSVADLNRNGLQSAPVETRSTTQNVGVGLQNEQLALAIQHGLRWKENICAYDSVDLLLVSQSRRAGRVAQIHGDH